jgi:lipoprotein-releasing system permease protein
VYQSFLSWRFLTARRINWVGIIGVFVGVTALILILSIMSGFLDQQRRMVRGTLSHLVIEPSPLMSATGAPLPETAEPLIQAVSSDPRVANSCAQLSWFALLIQGGRGSAYSASRLSDTTSAKLVGVQIVGIDTEAEYQTTELREALNTPPAGMSFGHVPVTDPEDPFAAPSSEFDASPWAWCVVGQQLAIVHGLRRGSEINLGTMIPDPQTGEVRQSNRKFLVAGTFRTGENESDLGRIYVDRSELHDFLATSRDYSQVLVKLHDYDRDGQALSKELSSSLAEAGLIRASDLNEVRTWEQYRGNILGAIENEKVLMAIMLSLVLVVAGFSVFAILTMMVAEKRRDIGILSALGGTRSGTLMIFLLIGFWDALLGAGAGAVAGVLGAKYIDPIERSISGFFGVQIFDRKVYLFDHIPAVIDPYSVAAIVLGAFLCTLTFAAIPAWRASRLNPLDALRYE